MTPTPFTTLPVIEGGLLDQLYRSCDAFRWSRSDLDALRMMADEPPAPDPDKPDPDKNDDAEARIARANKEAADRRGELKPWKDLAKDLGVTPEEARELIAKAKKPAKDKATEKDDEKPDLEALRKQIRDEVAKENDDKANRRVIRSEVKALAADLFADPADAPLYLNLDAYDVDGEGEVDEDQIREDLKALLKRKPHLAKVAKDETDPKKGGRLKPDVAQGKREVVKTGAEAGRAEAERRFAKTKADSTK